MFDKRQLLPPKTRLWAGTCHQNPRCLRKVFFERILLPMAGVAGRATIFFGVKLLSKSIAGRIVLSHVHVSTLRGTWSTQKLMSSGGGMATGIDLSCFRRRT